MAATPLYTLDTDHVSLLQRGNLAFAAHLQETDPQQCAVAVITVAEQVQGRLAQIRAIRTEQDAPLRFRLLEATLLFYQEITILPYTEEAAAHFVQWRQAKLPIGTQDLRNAAIDLVNGAIVVTGNRRDFRHVPGLALEDWSI